MRRRGGESRRGEQNRTSPGAAAGPSAASAASRAGRLPGNVAPKRAVKTQWMGSGWAVDGQWKGQCKAAERSTEGSGSLPAGREQEGEKNKGKGNSKCRGACRRGSSASRAQPRRSPPPSVERQSALCPLATTI